VLTILAVVPYIVPTNGPHDVIGGAILGHGSGGIVLSRAA